MLAIALWRALLVGHMGNSNMGRLNPTDRPNPMELSLRATARHKDTWPLKHMVRPSQLLQVMSQVTVALNLQFMPKPQRSQHRQLLLSTGSKHQNQRTQPSQVRLWLRRKENTSELLLSNTAP